MSYGMRAAFLLATSLIWIGWTATLARSEPSAQCRQLASQFGTGPGQLDGNALAALGTCVMAKIQERSGASDTAPSASAPVGQGRQDQWPSPAPWGDGQGEAQPWGDHIAE